MCRNIADYVAQGISYVRPLTLQQSWNPTYIHTHTRESVNVYCFGIACALEIQTLQTGGRRVKPGGAQASFFGH